jgi:hypothetical protein
VQNPIRITHFGYHIKGPVKNSWFKEHWNCFDVHKDIVAVPHDAANLPRQDATWPSSLAELLRNKTYLMMYSGWVDVNHVRAALRCAPGLVCARGVWLHAV